MKEVQVKVPGKLYIAGEYAVVERRQSAILLTVDSFLTVKIKDTSNDFGSIYSKGFTDEPVPWSRKNGQVVFEHSEKELKYILSAMRTVEDYVRESGYQMKFYDVESDSELDSESGEKYGLGSSGAITVAMTEALLKFYEVDYSDLLVYKLSVIAQLRLEVNSSFGDLAAIAYTGWIRYTNFDLNHVLSALFQKSVKNVVAMDWPYLIIQRLEMPEETRLLIGWTGSPAITDDMVGEVQNKKKLSREQYEHFLSESRESVNVLMNALNANAPEFIRMGMLRNRHALLQMGEETNVVIETPRLKELCDIAWHYGGAAKTSGAGGGDSGIAFVFDDESANNIIREWKKAGITNLPLTIYNKNQLK